MFSLRFSFMDDFVTLTEKKIGVPIFSAMSRNYRVFPRKNCQVSRFPEKSPDSRNNFSYVPEQRLLELSPPVIMSQIMQKKMLSTEFTAMFKRLSLLRTSTGDLILLCCLSVSLPQLKSLNNVLNTVNIYNKT